MSRKLFEQRPRAVDGRERRSRRLVSGFVAMLAVLAAGAGCRDGSGAVAERLPDYEPPEIDVGAEGERLVRNTAARERLVIHDDLAGSTVRLLFLDGRAASPLPDGGAAWAELDGDRVLLFDDRGRIGRVLQGGPEGDEAGEAAEAASRPLSDPVFVFPTQAGLRVEERDGAAMLFPTQGSARRLQPSNRPALGGSQEARFVGRSVLYFAMTPVRAGDPLLWRIGEDGEEIPVGRVQPSPQPVLGELENSGWAAPSPDEGTYFAPALRPELLRFDGEGELVWRASWPIERDLPPPGLEAVDGALQPTFSVVHHGMTRGPDGLVYLLAASRQEGRPDRLLVFDDDGVLIREARVEPEAAVFADRRGRTFALPMQAALARTPEAERPSFQSFDLPALSGEGRVRLDDYAGQPVIVNFWASWCPPCRRELPLLDELSRELADRGVVVIGLNDDVDDADGREFVDEVGGVSFPLAAGRGELRARYGYRGLPYTVVLDREHRVAQMLYGFGSSLEPLRSARRRTVR